ncbi:nicotinate-nicotinamide nucleotide adenylyltransferase [Leptospira sp. WS60.C2]
MDVLLFGGSFNPPHIGHRHVVLSLIKQFPKSKVYICPNFISPFKISETKFSKDEIWSLCNSEFAPLLSKSVILWDEEIKKDIVSYTIDTLQTLKVLEPNASISLVIGEDNLRSFKEWKSYQMILEQIRFLVVIRRITEFPKPIPCPNEIDSEKLVILDNPILTVSSREIRNGSENDWKKYLLPNTIELLKSFHSTKKMQRTKQYE